MSAIRASRRKYHIIYKTTCLATSKWYIGMHSTDDLDDGYMGSGQQLRRSIKKHGKGQHKTEVLEFLPDRKTLGEREAELVTRKLMEDKLCMNLTCGGTGAVDRPLVTKESTSKKITEAGLKRWGREKAKLAEQPFSMTREEIIAELVLPNGCLNKNATRNLVYRDTEGMAAKPLRVAKKWNYILDQLQNPAFPDASVLELVNAFVNQIEHQPVCKMCQGKVTFFRFNQPYAIYCGASCQMKDPAGNSRRLQL